MENYHEPSNLVTLVTLVVFPRNFQTVKLASQVRRSQIESHRELRLRHQVVLWGCGSKLIDGWGTSKYLSNRFENLYESTKLNTCSSWPSSVAVLQLKFVNVFEGQCRLSRRRGRHRRVVLQLVLLVQPPVSMDWCKEEIYRKPWFLLYQPTV